MRYFISCLLFFLSSVGFSQIHYDWATNSSGWHQGINKFIAVDRFGNSFFTGDFTSTQDFDPGPDVYNLTPIASNDVSLVKLDSAGNFLWAKGFGGVAGDHGMAVVTDEDGNVYCAGSFEFTVDFDPTGPSGTLTSNGESDIFILKLDTDGNFIWVISVGGSLLDFPRSLDVRNGFLVYCGHFNSAMDFDPGPNIHSVTYSGSTDAFISKLDTSGNFHWVKTISSPNSEAFYGVSIDNDNDIITTGFFDDFTDIDPGLNSNTIFAPNRDGFLLKLDEFGNYLWHHQFNCSYSGSGKSVDTDTDDNVILVGTFNGEVDFNSANPSFNHITPTNTSDGLIAKTDPSGNLIWTKHLTGHSQDELADVVTDSLNNVFVTGYYMQSINLDTAISNYQLQNVSHSSFTSFVAKYDLNSNFQWGISQIGSVQSIGKGITVNKYGNVIAGGSFAFEMELNDMNGTINLNGTSGYDNCFIIKLDDCSNSFSNYSTTSCNSLLSPSEKYTWTQSGIYNDTIANHLGCDSILTINLTLLNSSNNVDSTSCNPILSPDEQELYEYTGIYFDTLINHLGCDSIIISQVEINFSTNYIDTTHCSFITSPDGNENYYTDGIYYDTLMNSIGCDSIITIEFTIMPLNNSVLISGDSLWAGLSGVSYQWLDCNNKSAPIIGANQQFYVPPQNGFYSIEISNLNCTDTSNCIIFSGNGFSDSFSSNNGLYIMNPSREFIQIRFKEIQEDFEISIHDMNGKIIYVSEFDKQKLIQIQNVWPDGLYVLKLKTKSGIYTYKLILQRK